MPNGEKAAPFADIAKNALPGKAGSGCAVVVSVVLAIASVACSASAQQQRTKAEQNSGAASELRIVAANVQLLLIAPDGKETGYDPKTRKIAKTIPGSAYNEDALLAYDSGRVDPNTTQTIDVKHPSAGKYRLVVSPGTAADGEEYEVRVHLYRPAGGEARNVRIAGTARRNKAATYEIQVKGEPPELCLPVARPRGKRSTDDLAR